MLYAEEFEDKLLATQHGKGIESGWYQMCESLKPEKAKAVEALAILVKWGMNSCHFLLLQTSCQSNLYLLSCLGVGLPTW